MRHKVSTDVIIASCMCMVVLNIYTKLGLETLGSFHGGPLPRHRPMAGDSWQVSLLCSSLT